MQKCIIWKIKLNLSISMLTNLIPNKYDLILSNPPYINEYRFKQIR